KITFKSSNSSTIEVQPYKFIPHSTQNGLPGIIKDGNTTRLVQRSQLSTVEVFQDSQGIHKLLFPIVWFSDKPTNTLQRILPTLYDDLPTPAINISQSQDLWIDHWIPDSNLKNQLTSVSSNLAHRYLLQFYTDGSLRVLTPPSHPGQAPDENFVDVSMGAAFIESHSNTQIGARIQNWPSSTRAELMGIFLALLVSLPNSIVHIHTDSQSAIHSINNVLQHKNARRCRWLNHNNNLLLFKIYLLITKKRLQYFMHKIKGHSGDVGNDKADELAKLSLDLDNFYDNRFTHSSNEFRFMPQYNRTPIEQNIRKFIHRALHFRNYSAWSRLKFNIDCFVDKRFDYDWQTTWSTIKQVKFFKCTSTKRNSLWSFIIKALHNQLPIATRLKQRKPALYSDLKCQFCHTNEETTNHLSTCTQTADFRTYLRSELIYFLNNTDEFQKLSPHIRSRTINSLLGSSLDSFECTSLLSDAMQAKISTTAISHLKKNLKLSRADS
ncbi:ribonuclease H-like protein, partial [Rhizophagus irregularis]